MELHHMIPRTVIIRLFSGTLLAALVLGCGGDNEHPTDTGPFFKVTPLYSGLIVGSTAQLTAELGADVVPVTWSSNDTEVITVSASGLVTAISAGRAAATAALVSDPTKLSSASFTVVSPPTLVSGTPLTDLASSGERGSGVLYRIFVPTGKTSLTVTLRGGTGDADIYVQRQTPPDNSGDGDCFSFNGGNNEDCVIANPAAGTWYILIDLWDPYAGADLTATVTP